MEASEALNWGWMQLPVEEHSSLDRAESLEKVRSGANAWPPLLLSYIGLGLRAFLLGRIQAPKLMSQSFRTVLQHLHFLVQCKSMPMAGEGLFSSAPALWLSPYCQITRKKACSRQVA